MPEEEKKRRKHTFTLEDRASAHIAGVSEVLSYDPQLIELATDFGHLLIGGTGLNIASFERGSGVLEVGGSFDSLQYVDAKGQPGGGSFFSRLLR